MPILGIMASQISGHLFAPSGAYDSIATVTVGSGGSSSVSFTSIPATYQHLQIRGITRDNRASQGASNLNLRFNSDTGSNYRSHFLYGNSSVAISADDGVGTEAFIARIGGSTAASNCFGGFVVDVLDYANSNKYKTIRGLSGIEDNTTNTAQVYFNSSLWMNTGAVTNINLFGVGSTLQEYSSFALYGIRGN